MEFIAQWPAGLSFTGRPKPVSCFSAWERRANRFYFRESFGTEYFHFPMKF